ncbi:hypothetical protein CVT26_005813 [Gymnopilus dilepis]|uniref:Uncharacterized protein n=1 Tax=Gymnopilus dilepis TaxID=231916 RepID=A0A409WG53_9AGAR|nr:hypothetical protein CVT26_005813 [Gymnopilus dilepis]
MYSARATNHVKGDYDAPVPYTMESTASAAGILNIKPSGDRPGLCTGGRSSTLPQARRPYFHGRPLCNLKIAAAIDKAWSGKAGDGVYGFVDPAFTYPTAPTLTIRGPPGVEGQLMPSSTARIEAFNFSRRYSSHTSAVFYMPSRHREASRVDAKKTGSHALVMANRFCPLESKLRWLVQHSSLQAASWIVAASHTTVSQPYKATMPQRRTTTVTVAAAQGVWAR